MPNLTQLGTNGPFLGSIYSVVVYTDDTGQTWVAHHTDKTRNYKTDWDAQKVAEAIEGGKTLQDRLNESHKAGVTQAKHSARLEHNRLPWWRRIRKKT